MCPRVRDTPIVPTVAQHSRTPPSIVPPYDVVPRGHRKRAHPTGLDDEVIDWFRQQVNDAGGGDYQTLINAALREHIRRRSGDMLEETLRTIIREELRAAG